MNFQVNNKFYKCKNKKLFNNINKTKLAFNLRLSQTR